RYDFGAIKISRDIFPGIELHAVARRDPPQHTMDDRRARRRNRRITVGGDDEAMIRKGHDADRRRGRRVAVPDVAMHVGAVGEMQHHIAPTQLGRVAAQSVAATATMKGRQAITTNARTMYQPMSTLGAWMRILMTITNNISPSAPIGVSSEPELAAMVKNAVATTKSSTMASA